MSNISAVLEPHADGTVHVPIPKEWQNRKVKLEGTLAPVEGDGSADVFRKMICEVESFRTLPKNWNSYDADPPNEFSISWAKSTLSHAQTLGLLPERVSPSAENGIAVVFLNGNRYADIECFNSEEILGAVHERSKQPEVWEIKSEGDVKAALERIRAFLNE